MIVIASDHAGFELKQHIIKYLTDNSYEFTDVGCYSEASVDYPEYADKAVEKILSKGADKGILICGTGIGISIAANRHRGIRAALCGDVYSAKSTRQHNDANVLVLGGRVTGSGLAAEITEAFLTTEFPNEEKHLRRINMLG